LEDLRHLVKRAAEKYNHKIAISYRKNGTVVQKNYLELDRDIDALGTALHSLGLKGAHIAIVGAACYEWIISYLAIVNGTGVVVPIDKELPAEEVAFLLSHSGAQAVIFDKKHEDVVRSIQPTLPDLKHLICFEDDGLDTFPNNVEKLVRKGYSLLKNGDRSFIDSPIDRYAMTAILYTSGTTGTSKGVMLSHYNIASTITGALKMIEISGKLMSVLPLHHSYECNLDMLGSIYLGVGLFINDNLKNTLVNLKYSKPKCLLLVPLFLETFHKRIWSEAKKSGKDKLLKGLIATSNLMLKTGVDLRRKLFKSVLDAFGGELDTIVCGGAPLNPELVSAFADIGITVLNGYGTTECSPL
ncbi:MAG TPA: AMP-binding protein, partial [Candidatus Avimonas sp.]|nr:AMP-binding protein [Candidatus Avimonas sp.]